MGDHGLEVGKWYYLDQNVAGGYTADAPTSGIYQQLFFVSDEHTILLSIEEAYSVDNAQFIVYLADNATRLALPSPQPDTVYIVEDKFNDGSGIHETWTWDTLNNEWKEAEGGYSPFINTNTGNHATVGDSDIQLPYDGASVRIGGNTQAQEDGYRIHYANGGVYQDLVGSSGYTWRTERNGSVEGEEDSMTLSAAGQLTLQAYSSDFQDDSSPFLLGMSASGVVYKVDVNESLGPFVDRLNDVPATVGDRDLILDGTPDIWFGNYIPDGIQGAKIGFTGDRLQIDARTTNTGTITHEFRNTWSGNAAARDSAFQILKDGTIKFNAYNATRKLTTAFTNVLVHTNDGSVLSLSADDINSPWNNIDGTAASQSSTDINYLEGYVGIGTNTPDTKLHVVGNGQDAEIALLVEGDNSFGGVDDGVIIGMKTASNDDFNSVNVGIGSTRTELTSSVSEFRLMVSPDTSNVNFTDHTKLSIDKNGKVRAYDYGTGSFDSPTEDVTRIVGVDASGNHREIPPLTLRDWVNRSGGLLPKIENGTLLPWVEPDISVELAKYFSPSQIVTGINFLTDDGSNSGSIFRYGEYEFEGVVGTNDAPNQNFRWIANPPPTNFTNNDNNWQAPGSDFAGFIYGNPKGVVSEFEILNLSSGSEYCVIIPSGNEAARSFTIADQSRPLNKQTYAGTGLAALTFYQRTGTTHRFSLETESVGNTNHLLGLIVVKLR